jgi:pyruvate/2-oxoglutarate dehydrogenase complex dihydrolipoamide dehydrogenase (E3) component
VEKADRLDFYPAEGRFVGQRRFAVDGAEIEADRIFLIAGLRTAIPAVDGLDQLPYLTSRTLLDLRELPAHLVVVGGGYIGCEFAQMFRRFGAKVTIVHRADRLLPAEDPEISAAVADGFAADGIDVLTGTTCVAVDGTAGDLRVGCAGAEAGDLPAIHLLIAAGRTPNSDQLGLEHLDLQPDERGFLPVDDTLHTAADDVWALGDLRGGPMFTHTARDDADVVYRSVFRGGDRTTTGRVVPHAVFVDPEVAAVGLTEQQARDAGYDVIVGRQEFSGVAKARAIGNTRGLIKFVADAATDRILGCHIAGPDAGNLIHEAVIAMVTGATYGDIARTIHVHPTLAEGVNAAAGGVHRPAG